MAAEDRYAMPTGVALRSIQENLRAGVTVDVYILDGGIGRRNNRKLIASLDPERLRLHWIRPDDTLVEGLPVFGHIRPAAYYRILSPRVLPPEIDKALYIDCDVVVLADISPLWDMPFDGAPLQAIRDGDATLQSRGITAYEGVGEEAGPEPYMNSGVLVFDLLRWRDEGLCERVLESLRRNHGRVQFWDQDGLNASLHGNWAVLESKWNHRVDCAHTVDVEPSEYLDSLASEAVVVHFASSLKPWHYYAEHPACELFFKYLDMTAWAGWRPPLPMRAYLNRYLWGAWLRRLPVVGRAWAAYRSRNEAVDV